MNKILSTLLSLFVFSNAFSQSSNVFYVESFNTDGNTLRYNFSHYFDTLGSTFKIGDKTSFTTLSLAATVQNNNNGKFVGIEKTTGITGAPADGIVTITSRTIDITNRINLGVDLQCAALQGEYDKFTNANADWLNVEYRINSGSWVNAIKVRANNAKNTNNNIGFDINKDDNFNPTNEQLIDNSFKTYKFEISQTGNTIQYRVVARFNQEKKNFY